MRLVALVAVLTALIGCDGSGTPCAPRNEPCHEAVAYAMGRVGSPDSIATTASAISCEDFVATSPQEECWHIQLSNPERPAERTDAVVLRTAEGDHRLLDVGTTITR